MKDFKKEIANNEAAAAPVKYAVPTVTSSPTKATSKVCMESKSFQTFRSNMEWLDTHVQLVDASLIYAIKSMKKYPDKVAFEDKNHSVSFRELRKNHLIKAICIKYGSYTSSIVTFSSPSAAASVSSPTGPPL